MSGISKIPNLVEQEILPVWKVGWMTGWYNPFSRLGETINPAEVGRLVAVQGEYMVNQGRLVQELGNKLNELFQGANIKGANIKSAG